MYYLLRHVSNWVSTLMESEKTLVFLFAYKELIFRKKHGKLYRAYHMEKHFLMANKQGF